MEDKNTNIEKVNIFEILRDSIDLCKENYKLLLQISFFSYLIFLFSNLLPYFKTLFEPGLATTLYNIFNFIVFFPVAYMDMKLTVTLWLAISSRYNNDHISTKEAFSLSAKTTWSYIGTSILYSLMIVPIILIFIPIFLMIKVEILKWILLLLSAALILYLGTIYGFAPIAAALEGPKESNFRLSKRLVEGNLGRIMLLQFIIEAISLSGILISNINPWFKALMYTDQIAAQICYHFAYMFISPFMAATSIILYLILRNKVVFEENGQISNIIQE